MPARTYLLLIVTVIVCAGLTIAAAQSLGLSTAMLSLGFAAIAIGLRFWVTKK